MADNIYTFDQFTTAPIPETGSDASMQANFSTFEWNVFKDENGVQIKRSVPDRSEARTYPTFLHELKFPMEEKWRGYYRPIITAIKVDDGWLVGGNAGEFGGGLCWCSDDGSNEYTISKGNYIQFIVIETGIFAIAGIAHMGTNDGGIYRLSRHEGKWISTQLVDLNDAPYVATLSKDILFVVGSSLLSSFSMNSGLKTIYSNAFWSGMYPNSIIVDDAGSIVIGMRGGIVKVTTPDKAPTIIWMVMESTLSEAIDFLTGIRKMIEYH